MTLKAKPWLPFYWRDWQSDAMLNSCSWKEKGMLVDLMCMMWPYGGRLTEFAAPSVTELASNLSKSMGKRRDTIEKSLRILLDKKRLFVDCEGVLCCSKLMEVCETQRVMSERGKKGGNPQLKQEVKQELKPKAKQSKTEQSKAKKEEPVGFDLFWQKYPRKTAKKKALAAFIKGVCHTKMDTILPALDLQCESEQWTKDNGDYIPHPATWINQERWTDELKPKDGTKQDFDQPL